MTPYLGQLMLASWNYTTQGWAMCNGQLMAINQNQALFALLGTTYGGDGIRTFGLPNLQGRTPVGFGSGIDLGASGWRGVSHADRVRGARPHPPAEWPAPGQISPSPAEPWWPAEAQACSQRHPIWGP